MSTATPALIVYEAINQLNSAGLISNSFISLGPNGIMIIKSRICVNFVIEKRANKLFSILLYFITESFLNLKDQWAVKANQKIYL